MAVTLNAVLVLVCHRRQKPNEPVWHV